ALVPVAAGASGEIWLGDVHPGSCVGKGYFGMPEKTVAVITGDGWFRTGDIGFFDDEGYLHVTGRVDDMFTVGGFNVYPAEIEKTLERHELVREAYVVPVPDRRLGNVPVAWVAIDKAQIVNPEAIVQWCRTQMTPQKAPRRVFFYGPGELPMTPVGKVRRKELAQRSAALVAAQEPGAGSPPT
ncbi:MAG: fatty acid--CoA ligase family protein, partial [Betaproteobacteria bacterium]|nr:fatty acid--CoA ligase family protein [Betaproteobacteria bacterium]